jgi:hypothetical protein
VIDYITAESQMQNGVVHCFKLKNALPSKSLSKLCEFPTLWKNLLMESSGEQKITIKLNSGWKFNSSETDTCHLQMGIDIQEMDANLSCRCDLYKIQFGGKQ